jgi:hypothetical protein
MLTAMWNRCPVLLLPPYPFYNCAATYRAHASLSFLPLTSRGKSLRNALHGHGNTRTRLAGWYVKGRARHIRKVNQPPRPLPSVGGTERLKFCAGGTLQQLAWPGSADHASSVDPIGRDEKGEGVARVPAGNCWRAVHLLCAALLTVTDT